VSRGSTGGKRDADESRLNAICPYFTMFSLDFPLGILSRNAYEGDWVLDPFCGRGTTGFAARLLGLGTVGIDSSPVAAAIAAAKLKNVSAQRVLAEAESILSDERYRAPEVPNGEFWRWAFSRRTLLDVCRLRTALLEDCSSPSRVVLRAVVLGALHGPTTKKTPSHLSNQAPRTFAPKPDYSVRFWRARGLRPKDVDTRKVIELRANRYLAPQLPRPLGTIRLGDSRKARSMRNDELFDWVITSPPYYGMRTYIQDQWLRNWFLGGPPEVDYAPSAADLTHRSRDDFVEQLRTVWGNAREASNEGAKLVCRFGTIRDRDVDPRSILRESLLNTGWVVSTIRDAGSAMSGKRQAQQFAYVSQPAQREIDVYAVAV
jgi:hypothetical protein